VTSRALRLLAAIALAAAAARVPAAPQLDPVAEAGRDLTRLAERLRSVESEYGRPDESGGARAAHAFAQGEVRFLLGDWQNASVLLYDALDRPELPPTDRAAALHDLGESLWQQRRYASALASFRALLADGAARGTPRQADAAVRALDCLVRLGRHREVPALLELAREVLGGALPPEALYLAAKAAYHRDDLPPSERQEAARKAFDVVPPPFHLAASYFKGALSVQAGALDAAAGDFERCADATASDARQAEIRELCGLALARVQGELGRWSLALERYHGVPRSSPRYHEALYESAWIYVKARRYDLALRTAGLVADLAPESPLAAQATLLQGHLALKLDRHGEAVDVYGRVVATYAPVRDELDAILTLHEDPVRYFDELVHRDERGFSAASVLPPIALRWAATQRQVAQALEVVAALESARRDLVEGRESADRLEAALSRGFGLGAYPHLEEGYARAEAIENAAARLEGRLATEEASLHGPAFAAGEAYRRARLDRETLEARLRALPATPEEVEARVARDRSRVAGLEKAAFKLRNEAQSCAAALAGLKGWMGGHAAEVGGDARARRELDLEIEAHRDVVAGYERELAALRTDLSRALDAAGHGAGGPADDALREAYRERVSRERELLAAARVGLMGEARARAEALDAVREQLAALQLRADQAKRKLLGVARTGGEALRAQVAAERARLEEDGRALAAVGGEAQDLVGRIAYDSFQAVRTQLYRLVLKADVGIVDVAWTRKRQRLDRIQALSAKKAEDLSSLEDGFSGVLKEVE
jgi:hypothetical protein